VDAGIGHPWRIVWALVGLGLLGAGLVNFMWPADSQEPASTSPPVLVDKPDAAGPSAPAPAAGSPVADESDRVGLVEPVALPRSSRCALDANAQVISPDRPSKPADYVYLVASRQVTVCVQDASGRQSRVTLQAGRNVNIPGRPPFDLTADTLSHLQVFFQGQRMAVPAGMTGVRLQAQDTRR
jgi:hypothetical protein